eukprot:1391639-Amorphochlora_amoeboformis.AAC.1
MGTTNAWVLQAFCVTRGYLGWLWFNCVTWRDVTLCHTSMPHYSRVLPDTTRSTGYCRECDDLQESPESPDLKLALRR